MKKLLGLPVLLVLLLLVSMAFAGRPGHRSQSRRHEASRAALKYSKVHDLRAMRHRARTMRARSHVPRRAHVAPRPTYQGRLKQYRACEPGKNCGHSNPFGARSAKSHRMHRYSGAVVPPKLRKLLQKPEPRCPDGIDCGF